MEGRERTPKDVPVLAVPSSLLSYYLGIEVKQDELGITRSQERYANKILDLSDFAYCNSCEVPTQAKLKLSKKDDSPV